jgi:hypothetical protein
MEEDNDSFEFKGLPIYQKGMEIYELTSKIVDLIPEDDKYLLELKGFMLEDAAMLTVKIAGAEGGDLYDLRMECAAIIRKAARDLIVHCRGLQMFGFKETHYLDLIREEIEQFRILFIEWVAGFDMWNYEIDRWGLFNPPGVSPDDNAPDDDF